MRPLGTSLRHAGLLCSRIGSGTDAAFAALDSEAPVLEGMGLRNFGAHSSNAEYINISSIEPRLYLVARLILDIADGKTANGR